MGAQNAAGSIVTMVAPARVILAATAGLPGKEGHILRTLGPLILIAIAIITILLLMVI